jgi:flagellar FliL protein
MQKVRMSRETQALAVVRMRVKVLVKVLAKVLALIGTLALPLSSGATEAEVARYVSVARGLVVNYGEPSLSRLHYMKVSLDLRVNSRHGVTEVERHIPLIKDELIGFLSSQSQRDVTDGPARESLRQNALALVRAVIEREEGEPFVEDLLWTSFVVQR